MSYARHAHVQPEPVAAMHVQKKLIYDCAPNRFHPSPMKHLCRSVLTAAVPESVLCGVFHIHVSRSLVHTRSPDIHRSARPSSLLLQRHHLRQEVHAQHICTPNPLSCAMLHHLCQPVCKHGQPQLRQRLRRLCIPRDCLPLVRICRELQLPAHSTQPRLQTAARGPSLPPPLRSGPPPDPQPAVTPVMI